MQRQYQYSKWDSIHEPYNIVENVLKDDESVFKTVGPCLDFSLFNGQMCFVSEVILYPGDCGPQIVEVNKQLLFVLDSCFKLDGQMDFCATIHLHKEWTLKASDARRACMQVFKD